MQTATVKPLLQATVIVLQRQIEDSPLVNGIVPQGEAHADVVGKLGHQERLAHLGYRKRQKTIPLKKIMRNCCAKCSA